MSTDSLKLEAQAALDELMQEGKLLFKLEARELISNGSQYTIGFHDSRLHSIIVKCEAGQSFKEIVRAAVLDGVSKLKKR
jgi:hypothetical protein